MLTRPCRRKVLGTPGNLPEVFSDIEVQYFLLRRLLGVKAGGADSAEGEKTKSKGSKVQKIAKDEVLMVNIGSTSCGAQVRKRSKKEVAEGQGEVSTAKLKLLSPVCTKVGEKIALSRRVDKHWRCARCPLLIHHTANHIKRVIRAFRADKHWRCARCPPS